jgi:c-di-GMP-binding flagellar brake protein YcgR
MSVRQAKVVEKRHHSRVKVTWPVLAECDRRIINGEAINISHSGALILTQEPLEPGKVCEMDVNVPFRYRPIWALAEVVRLQTAGYDVEYGPYGMGVQFIVISEEDRESIASFVLNQQAMEAFTKLQYI